MRSSGNSGGRQRKPGGSQTSDPQCDGGGGTPALFIVGLGPGDPRHLSARAGEALAQAHTVVGYQTYIDLIQPLIAGKEVIRTGMMREVERAEAALEAALQGKRCAIVSSGDAGIYAMAGLVLELCRLRTIPIRLAHAPAGEQGLTIEIVPGIPALAAGAALLGAPLTHDFAAISLSDLLTPWPQIEIRLDAAARADFVIVLYNPRSKRRRDHLARASAVIARHRNMATPVGVVTGAMRPNQCVALTSLGALPEAAVDMQTTLFVGNSSTQVYGGCMITPRGYARKYDVAADGDRHQKESPDSEGKGR